MRNHWEIRRVTPRKKSKTASSSGSRVKERKVGRSVSRPDILFCAADERAADGTLKFWIDCTGTTNWVNNADLNANTNGEGPGVIVPPIKITFHKLGDEVVTTKYSHAPDDYAASIYSHAWGSFNDATNLPVAYPDSNHASQGPFAIYFHAFADNRAQVLITNQMWNLQVPLGGVASLQISTNKFDWTGLVMVTNAGVSIDWYHYKGDATQSFRAVAE